MNRKPVLMQKSGCQLNILQVAERESACLLGLADCTKALGIRSPGSLTSGFDPSSTMWGVIIRIVSVVAAPKHVIIVMFALIHFTKFPLSEGNGNLNVSNLPRTGTGLVRRHLLVVGSNEEKGRANLCPICHGPALFHNTVCHEKLTVWLSLGSNGSCDLTRAGHVHLEVQSRPGHET